jgi:mannose-6-phosphate isomerase
MPSLPKSKPEVGYVERPWGHFKQFANNVETTVSLMSVKPGQRLSLQSHTQRAELWVVIDDGAIVQVGDEVFHAKAGDEFWIPANTQHRLSSSADATQDIRVLEVAFGSWQANDIIRYEDDYDRLQAKE